MFVCFFLVVLLNALGHESSPKSPRNPYSDVAFAMILSCIAIGGAAAAGWDYSILAIEAALIFLFAVFWGLQTHELWDRGLRTRSPAPDGS
jgi:hypothetical protein